MVYPCHIAIGFSTVNFSHLHLIDFDLSVTNNASPFDFDFVDHEPGPTSHVHSINHWLFSKVSENGCIQMFCYNAIVACMDHGFSFNWCLGGKIFSYRGVNSSYMR